MAHEFEYDSYDDADRIAMLENTTAELRRLIAVMPREPGSHWASTATPGVDARDRTQAELPLEDGADRYGADRDDPYQHDPYQHEPLADDPYQHRRYQQPTAPEDHRAAPAAWPPGGGAAAGRAGRGSSGDSGPRHHGQATAGSRTEALINHGRQRVRRSRGRRLRAHWRLITVAAAAALAGIIAGLAAFGGSGASWPASVTTVRAQIKQACQNGDTAAEPSGLNFACGTDTQQVLWVFSLLTSGNNPGFTDQSTGRKGLEPIQPAQGGNIAWSLNLHHPYNPASPLDSLQVAARAINNIISGATLTSSSGALQVEAGLESKGANCQRYTGSARLVSRSGYPARCAEPVTSGAGQAALVSDVFQQWMGGTPSTIAKEAGVLFENANNPGDSRVQAILGSLPSSTG
jgi:hypothetical protein